MIESERSMDLDFSVVLIYSHVCLLVYMRFAIPFHCLIFHIFDDDTSRFCPTLVMFGLFFLGHCQRYGFNVQALTDHVGCFIFIAVAPPASQGNISALERMLLLTLLNTLPLGYFIIGDNA
jgi:hypothetical protein